LIRTLVGAGPLISEKLKGPPTRSQPKFLRCRLGPAWRSRAGHRETLAAGLRTIAQRRDVSQVLRPAARPLVSNELVATEE